PPLLFSWKTFIIRGIASLCFGVLALLWPGVTAYSLVLLFGAYALVDGMAALAAAARQTTRNRGAFLIDGALGVLAGGATLLVPGVTEIALLYLIGGWAVATGIVEIVAGFSLGESPRAGALFVLAGLVSLAFGGFIFARPVPGVMAIVGVIAAYAFMFGMFMT